jgi:hypothetical protein
MENKKIVSVSLGGQQVTIEVPVIEANRAITTCQGGLLYSRNYHFWYAGGKASVAARIGALPLSVLMYLIYRADWQTLKVEVGKWEIAEGITMSKRAVDRAIQTLIREKVIMKFDNADPTGRGDRNVYLILTPVVRKKGVTDTPLLDKGAPNAPLSEPNGCTGYIGRVQEMNEKGAPDAPPLKGITRLRDLTTTASSSSFEKVISPEAKRIADAFFAGAERRPNRYKVSRSDVEDWAEKILKEYRLEHFLEMVIECWWAEHPKGIEKTLRVRYMNRDQLQALEERNRQREQARQQAAAPVAYGVWKSQTNIQQTESENSAAQNTPMASGSENEGNS